jgi:hypothetical protein
MRQLRSQDGALSAHNGSDDADVEITDDRATGCMSVEFPVRPVVGGHAELGKLRPIVSASIEIEIIEGLANAGPSIQSTSRGIDFDCKTEKANSFDSVCLTRESP